MAFGGTSTRWTTVRVFLLYFLAICVAQDNECVVLVDPNAEPVVGDVCGTPGQECPTIVEAIDSLDSGNRTDCKLRLLPGIYEGEGNVNIIALEFSKWDTIESAEGNEDTIIDCNAQTEVHAIQFGYPSMGVGPMDEVVPMRNFTVSGLTIRNCNGSEDGFGAVSSAQHNLVVKDSVFYDNINLALAPTAGGGLKVSKSEWLRVSNCHFERNTAGFGGGLLASEIAEIYIEDSYFYQNGATKLCAGMLIQHSEYAYLRNVTFLDHIAVGPAALQIMHVPNVELVDVVINEALAVPVPWGAMNAVSIDLLDNNNPDTTLVMRNVQIINSNGGQEGAAMIGQFRDIEMINCTFQGNSGETAAGAAKIYATSDTEGQEQVSMKLLIEDCYFDQNEVLGGFGGALDIAYTGVSDVTAEIVNSVFSNNVASDYGGAIVVRSDEIDMQITGCVFSNNTAMDFEGGAIFFEENAAGDVGLRVENSRFSNNSAEFGGAIFATIVEISGYEGNIFEDNFAEEKGGSIFGSGMTFKNDEFINSRAKSYGGGAYAQRGEIVIESSKFTGCSADFGGGMTIGSLATLDAEDLTCDSCHATGHEAYIGVSGYGGCIFFEEESCYLSQVSGTFEGNVADTAGGVFFVEDGRCDVCGEDVCEFIDNDAPYGVEAASPFSEVRLDGDVESFPIIPGNPFTILLHAFDSLQNHLADRHTLIHAIADFEAAEGSGVLIEGQSQILFVHGTAEFTLTPYLFEATQEGEPLETSITLTIHFDPVVEILEVTLEYVDCGENSELVPVIEGALADSDPRVMACSTEEVMVDSPSFAPPGKRTSILTYIFVITIGGYFL